MPTRFENEHVSLAVSPAGSGALDVRGAVKAPGGYASMELLAAAPIDRMTSYAGSGLPWPSAELAFADGRSRRPIPPDGTISARIAYPNSYYAEGGTDRVGPAIFVRLARRGAGTEPVVVKLDLEDPVPLRSLTHRPERRGPEFYAHDDIEVMGALATMVALGEAKVAQGRG